MKNLTAKKQKLLSRESSDNLIQYMDTEGYLMNPDPIEYEKLTSSSSLRGFYSDVGGVRLGKAQDRMKAVELTHQGGGVYSAFVSDIALVEDKDIVGIYWYDSNSAMFRVASTNVSAAPKTAIQQNYTDVFTVIPEVVVPGAVYTHHSPVKISAGQVTLNYTRGGVLKTAICDSVGEFTESGSGYEVGTIDVFGEILLNWTTAGVPDDFTDISVSYEIDHVVSSVLTTGSISVTLNSLYCLFGTDRVFASYRSSGKDYLPSEVNSSVHVLADSVTPIDVDYYVPLSEGETRVISFYAKSLIGSSIVTVTMLNELGFPVDLPQNTPVLSGSMVWSGGSFEQTLSSNMERYALAITGPADSYRVRVTVSAASGAPGANQCVITGLSATNSSVLFPYASPGSTMFLPIPKPAGDLDTHFEQMNGIAGQVLTPDGKGGTVWSTVSGAGLAITKINDLSATSQYFNTAVLQTDINPNFSDLVDTHTLNFLDVTGQYDATFDESPADYAGTGYTTASYQAKRGLITKLWHDRTRQVYNGIFRGAASYDWYVAGAGPTSGLSKILGINNTAITAHRSIVPLNGTQYLGSVALDWMNAYITNTYTTNVDVKTVGGSLAIGENASFVNIGTSLNDRLITYLGYCRMVAPVQTTVNLYATNLTGDNKIVTTVDLDCSKRHVFYLTAPATTGTKTINLNGMSDGQTVNIRVDANGTVYTLAWNTSVKWTLGNVPVPTVTSGRYDVYTFVKIGSVIFGSCIKDMH